MWLAWVVITLTVIGFGVTLWHDIADHIDERNARRVYRQLRGRHGT